MVGGVIVLFDVNGTLTDPSGLGEPWERPELGLVILRGAVQTAMVDALVGAYRPFSEHVRAAIETEVSRAGLDAGRIDAAAQRAIRLDPFPDAAAALDTLRDAGLPLATLTNSGSAGGRATLEAAGLADRFDRFLGVDAVHTFKPHPSTYAHAISELGARADDIVLVAAHSWDVTGAKHAGLRTGWISRGELTLTPMAPAPDFRADNLLEMARLLTA